MYAITLEKIIEEKISKNITNINEYEKYKSLIETENIKENKIEEFNIKIKSILKSNTETPIQNEKNLVQNDINIPENIEFNIISFEIINKYLNIIKNINEGKLNESLENDIKT